MSLRGGVSGGSSALISSVHESCVVCLPLLYPKWWVQQKPDLEPGNNFLMSSLSPTMMLLERKSYMSSGKDYLQNSLQGISLPSS
jgi:hypothetical protein